METQQKHSSFLTHGRNEEAGELVWVGLWGAVSGCNHPGGSPTAVIVSEYNIDIWEEEAAVDIFLLLLLLL